MRRAALALGLIAAVAAGCGTDGAPRFGGGPTNLETTFSSCAACHRGLAVEMLETGGHHDLSLKCEFCHDDLAPGNFGAGHRSVPACLQCHSEKMTHHDPAAGTASACVVCHTPHGSPNLFLVRKRIVTSSGSAREVQFSNILGLADGSFASVTHPGTGVCEVCHSATRFYRGDGSGEEHIPFPCFTCHSHSTGFSPR